MYVCAAVSVGMRIIRGISILRRNREIGSFEFARGGFETPYGRIQAEWEKKDGEVLYRLEVPANCSATVVLPDGRCEDVGSGAHEFAIK